MYNNTDICKIIMQLDDAENTCGPNYKNVWYFYNVENPENCILEKETTYIEEVKEIVCKLFCKTTDYFIYEYPHPYKLLKPYKEIVVLHSYGTNSITINDEVVGYAVQKRERFRDLKEWEGRTKPCLLC
jgi:hypothetical protein